MPYRVSGVRRLCDRFFPQYNFINKDPLTVECAILSLIVCGKIVSLVKKKKINFPRKIYRIRSII